jgi:hypothetical protein
MNSRFSSLTDTARRPQLFIEPGDLAGNIVPVLHYIFHVVVVRVAVLPVVAPAWISGC